MSRNPKTLTANQFAGTFYSALSREVEGLGLKSAPVAGWNQTLLGLVKAGRVKQDEIEWSGLQDWLQLQAGKVAKEDALAFLGSHGVQVQEMVLGSPDYAEVELPEWLKLSLIQSGHLGAQGRWWTPFVDVARWYARDAGPRGCVVFQDVPRAVVEASRVLGSDAERFSRAPHEELFLPAEYIGRGRPLAASQVRCRSSVTLRERAR